MRWQQFWCACLLAATSTATLAAEPQPRIVLESPERIVVTGLSDEALKSAGPNSLRVSVATADNKTPLLGTGKVVGNSFVFVPRFPLRAGVQYRAVFEPLDMETMLDVPDASNSLESKVAAVYPTADILPANQLKFYLHFTAPMSRGTSYLHVKLHDEQGVVVELPFVEIGEELWDKRQQRLTLLLDPGRIKRGLRPHNEVGPPLVAGHSYTLVIDKNWLDAERHLLQEEFRKSFRVEPSDRSQPNPAVWNIEVPAAGSTAPLVLQFGESLDHALLTHCLEVNDAAGETIAGTVTISDHESRWRFAPQTPWQTGQYKIRVDTRLEDLAGNSIQRPFEVKQATRQEKVPAHLELPFAVQ